MKLLLNFLPIIIIFLLVTYSSEMAQWSHTILGKLIAVLLMIFYTRIDILFGLVVTALVILYYQSDYVEGFIPNSEMEAFTLPEMDNDNENDNTPENQVDTPADVSFELLEDAYPESPTTVITYDAQVKLFRQKNCSKGHLVHKGQMVNNEMAEHVFPQVEQDDFHKCNICDNTCDFNFIDQKIKAQDEVMKPRSAR